MISRIKKLTFVLLTMSLILFSCTEEIDDSTTYERYELKFSVYADVPYHFLYSGYGNLRKTKEPSMAFVLNRRETGDLLFFSAFAEDSGYIDINLIYKGDTLAKTTYIADTNFALIYGDKSYRTAAYLEYELP